MRGYSYYKNFFIIAAIWNWVASAVFFCWYRQIFSLFGMKPLIYPVIMQLFLALVFVFGIGYYWVAGDIEKNHAIVKMGIIGKFLVFILLSFHWIVGNIPFFLVAPGIVDLIFAILFIEFILSFPKIKYRGNHR